jgi:hypothetical protein
LSPFCLSSFFLRFPVSACFLPFFFRVHFFYSCFLPRFFSRFILTFLPSFPSLFFFLVLPPVTASFFFSLERRFTIMCETF